MKSPLFIDGIDTLETYKVRVTDKGYNTLVQFPSLKKVESVDWPEDDGVEPDLLAPVLAAKDSIAITFVCSDLTKYDAFLDLLYDGAYHTFFFMEIGVTAVLRLDTPSEYQRGRRMEIFTLNFCFDASFTSGMVPYEGINWPLTMNGETMYFNEQMLIFFVYERGLEPHRTISFPLTGMLIDGADVNTYTMRPIENYVGELGKAAPVKKNLIIESQFTAGRSYPDTAVVKGAKDVTLPFLMMADMPTTFWRQYLRLLTDLTSPGHKTLTYGGKTHKFYYKSQQVREFSRLRGNAIWCKFNLTLCFFEGD